MLFQRQNGRCAYCGLRMGRDQTGGRRITLDHIVPRSQGGADEADNYVGACRVCNAAKGDMSAEAFRAARADFAGRGLPVVARRYRS